MKDLERMSKVELKESLLKALGKLYMLEERNRELYKEKVSLESEMQKRSV